MDEPPRGQSPFVWTVLGAIARETRTLRVGTGVTCPSMRIHPAVIAQAAATTARLFVRRPDVDAFVESVRRFEEAGYDHVWLHQVGRELPRARP